ncbi:bifunctional UDP-N-acetylglucosamine diphosphorylase/glucosamine-1-phosphate N-acetyltransferase GlmU [Pseudoclavibacter sp. RFBG4]|uniref:bifunctional UDP-N-acetylglucosamine diphosphorylase/glucosamine-1-phosphate N-acetyltransferase GlmU n=1 Tax=Pseudoclavibacter sp. RFBG4 TaxID=2080575 RepID=UPI000CE8BD14|nr:bifunctional UDP-N-acetylglucosamine diphosphorylase/glucosamine-1-phosphate N-acetyltransferase GlmU [Pseudoclavibacter sp. RFBG4]PPG26871.1 bifunctional UDP-N-acetylglucosamine diphosphorylase/glucosamine-1-phosphate N-acetyltransferase GlmU [Pseudoclavibacter sp. RFBG4]
MTDRELAIVILAAGQGTRMRSSTPKVLHRLGGIPLVGHVLHTAAELGPAHTVTVVRHDRDRVVSAIRDLAPDTQFADQDEVPGTGRALEVGLESLPADFDGVVVVLSGDVPLLDSGTIGRMIEQHRRAQNQLTLLSAFVQEPAGFGRIVRSSGGDFEEIVEHKDASEELLRISEINAGVYAFDARTVRQVLGRIDDSNSQREKYLTDAAKLIKADAGRIEAIAVTDPEIVQGINDRVQLAEAQRYYNARQIRHWQLEGVTVHDPATTVIEGNVSLGRDVELLPGTQLRGATSVAEGAIIGPDTTLVDCEVGEGAVVKRTDATLSVIGAGATVGPWAYLRPNTILGAGGKIGTFVETKNAQIGDGSKVPHLSYIGDTEVGQNSNVGAGTITANYDGVNKHRTTVGSNVRSGSHNVFVAPVRIGDGAYTGAGTVVRKDVPAGALAINVAPQRNAEGWVLKNRAGTAAAEAAEAASAADSTPNA